MVVGGGNTAVYEALYLSKMAQKVILIHRRDTLRAERGLIRQLEQNPKIEIMYETVIKSFHGDKKLSSVTIEQKGVQRELQIDGVFEAIGQMPNTEIFKGQLDIDESGFLVTDKHTMATSLPGVFACGDVQEKAHRQAIIAAASGCMAALNAEKFLLKNTP